MLGNQKMEPYLWCDGSSIGRSRVVRSAASPPCWWCSSGAGRCARAPSLT